MISFKVDPRSSGSVMKKEAEASFKMLVSIYQTGAAVAQWLRCCATNQRVVGSIPAGVIGTFHWHKNLSDRTMAQELTQPLTEMSTRSISWA